MQYSHRILRGLGVITTVYKKVDYAPLDIVVAYHKDKKELRKRFN